MMAALFLAATLAEARIVEAPPLRHAPPTRTTKLAPVQALYELPERDSMLLLRKGDLVELSMITGNETVLGRDLGATAVVSTIAFDRELLVVLRRGQAPLLFDARRNRTYAFPAGTDAGEFIAAPGGRYTLLPTRTAQGKQRLYHIDTQSFAVQPLAEGWGVDGFVHSRQWIVLRNDRYEQDVIDTATGKTVPQAEPPAPPPGKEGEITLTLSVSVSLGDPRLDDVELEPPPERRRSQQHRKAIFEDGRVVESALRDDPWLFDPATATRWRVSEGLPTPPPPEGEPTEHSEWVESQVFESFGSDPQRRLALVSVRHHHSTSYLGRMSYRAPTATTRAAVFITPAGERIVIDADIPIATNDVHVHHSGWILVANRKREGEYELTLIDAGAR